jgi:hypothetical protein
MEHNTGKYMSTYLSRIFRRKGTLFFYQRPTKSGVREKSHLPYSKSYLVLSIDEL